MDKNMNKIICLVSGGLDSFIGYHYLKEEKRTYGLYDEILPIHINYNAPYSLKEEYIIRDSIPESKIYRGIFNFQNLIEDNRAFIYARNLYLLTFASQFGKSIKLFGNANSIHNDSLKPFFTSLSETLCVLNQDNGYNISSPWMGLFPVEKEEVVDWYIDKHGYAGFMKILELTSCIHPTKLQCMECPQCLKYYYSLFDHIEFYDAFERLMFKKDSMIREDLKNVSKQLPRRAKTILKVAKHHGVKL